MLINRTFICSVLTLALIRFSFGAVVNPPIPKVENETKCSEANMPEWTIDSLKYVTIDAWPWSCLQKRYDNDTLNTLVPKSSPDIHDAASKGYIGFVQYYVRRYGAGTLHLTRDEDYKTPIQLAIANGHLNVVKYAVVEGNLVASYFLRMFQEAIYHSQFAIVDYFVEEKTFIPNLHADEEALVSLAAVRAGNLRMLKYLIEQKGFPVDIKDSEFLGQAAENGDLSIMEYLIEEKKFSVKRDDYDLLYSAALGGNVEILKYLVYNEHVIEKNRSCYRGTILHAAARSGNLKMVRFVVETMNHRQVNVNASDGTTPAHFAAAASFPALQYLVEERNADLDARRHSGDGLLHTAAAAGQLANVRYLVEQKNASIELKNLDGMTPLHKAVRAGKLDVVRYLASERKANVNGTSADGKNLLHQAAFGGEIAVMKFLVDDVKMASRLEETDSGGRTAATIAAEIDSLKILRYLVDERNVSTSFMDGGEGKLLWASAGQVSARRLATLRYLIEEKGLNVDALPSTDPMTHIYSKYFHCRYNDYCQWWDECPKKDVCRRWGQYLQELKTYLPIDIRE